MQAYKKGVTDTDLKQTVSPTNKTKNLCKTIKKKGVTTIRITVNEDIKIVQFWCGKEDTEAPGFTEKIEEIFAQIAPGDKFKKVIYRSGNGNLLSATSELIRRNLRPHSVA